MKPMGKRKGRKEQMSLVTPDTDPQKPAPPPEVPSEPAFFAPQDGVATAVPEPPSPSMDALLKAAITWAQECGLNGPFNVTGPERVDYPRHGHGYAVTVKEQTGKGRMGTARFTAEGKTSYWSMDTFTSG